MGDKTAQVYYYDGFAQEELGNTAAVCRKSYICPRVLDEYWVPNALYRPRTTGPA